ncbi:MAG TPA: helix-turn-helix domain-containing protein [Candidatus Thermoplasmatota archaeon]|nr:helix-turn-helix domain-containing protein [Candidatus Thermoplasmatota archaeon]
MRRVAREPAAAGALLAAALLPLLASTPAAALDPCEPWRAAGLDPQPYPVTVHNVHATADPKTLSAACAIAIEKAGEALATEPPAPAVDETSLDAPGAVQGAHDAATELLPDEEGEIAWAAGTDATNTLDGETLAVDLDAVTAGTLVAACASFTSSSLPEPANVCARASLAPEAPANGPAPAPTSAIAPVGSNHDDPTPTLAARAGTDSAASTNPAWIPRPPAPATSRSPLASAATPAFAHAPWEPPSTLLAIAAAIAAALISLLHRLHRDGRVFESDLRQRIYGLAVAHGHVTATEVARAMDVHKATARYHLLLLVDHGSLVPRRAAGRTMFVPAGDPASERELAARAMLAREPARRVLAALAQRPAASVRELAAATGLPASTAHWYAKRLRAVGATEPAPVL